MKLLRSVFAPMDQNAYIFVDEDTNECVVLDPGGDEDKLIHAIESNGLILKAILLTHAHGDHIGALVALKEKFGAPVGIYKDEADVLRSPELNFTGSFGSPRIAMEADILFEDGDVYRFGKEGALRVIHVPGHTPGGACYYSEATGQLFSGDCLFYGSVGRTDFPQYSKKLKAETGVKELGADGNMALLLKSIQEKLLVLPDDTRVYPGHGMPTTIGNEKKYNPYLR